ncbi:hypothetical protein ACFQRB_04845 [Halobaculum litoreum]|uniref:Uncharacterized protein n=1 Tax=Halobaculum litoreum TaxID=3031998 RepID=A0ABD5XV77_9EURY
MGEEMWSFQVDVLVVTGSVYRIAVDVPPQPIRSLLSSLMAQVQHVGLVAKKRIPPEDVFHQEFSDTEIVPGSPLDAGVRLARPVLLLDLSKHVESKALPDGDIVNDDIEEIVL